eukprot:SAG11_NODE_984_length_6296_cov_3.033887_4_plen_118_part_00
MHELVPWAAELSFDTTSGGAINRLRLKTAPADNGATVDTGGRRWAEPGRLLGQMRYETLDESDLEDWRDNFLYENGTSVARDYGKPNVTAGAPIHQLVAPSVSSAWMRKACDSLTAV